MLSDYIKFLIRKYYFIYKLKTDSGVVSTVSIKNMKNRRIAVSRLYGLSVKVHLRYKALYEHLKKLNYNTEMLELLEQHVYGECHTALTINKYYNEIIDDLMGIEYLSTAYMESQLTILLNPYHCNQPSYLDLFMNKAIMVYKIRRHEIFYNFKHSETLGSWLVKELDSMYHPWLL